MKIPVMCRNCYRRWKVEGERTPNGYDCFEGHLFCPNCLTTEYVRTTIRIIEGGETPETDISPAPKDQEQ